MELFLFQNGERIGPYTLDELQGWLDAGQVSSSDSVWFKGCEDWVTIREVPGIRISGMAGHAIDADLVPPFDAYQGDEPYIFVSYAHKDSAGVFEEIQRLHEAGYKIWYDEGIDAGNEWPEEIANAVIGCSLFLIFVTPRATESVNCRNEINMALNKGKPFLAIHLEETALPPGLELRMGDLQAILRYRLPQERYQQKAGIMLDQLLGKTPAKSKKQAPAVQQPEPSNEIEPVGEPESVARPGQPGTSLSVRAPAKPRRRGLAIALLSILLIACGISGFLFFKSRSSSPQPTPGQPWTVPTASIEMLWCKPGTFMMGSLENEKDRKDDETQHEVTLTKGFYLGKYEVTQAQWTEVMETNPSEFAGDDLPVEMVSWKDAMGFCQKLTELERAAGRIPDGWKYTLPTEAQWEYACRAGTTTVYAFGDKITTKQANFDKTLGKTTNIGKYLANAWGFHDMHGNVREWCFDWHNTFAKGSMRDPQGPAVGPGRVNRGGGWNYSAGGSMRSADRIRRTPGFRNDGLGFRLCLTQTQVPKASVQPTPGQPWTVPTGSIEMLWCKPGTFMMGRISDNPLHEVTLTKGFYLGKYEVTQAEWEKVMGTNPSEFKGATLPVEHVFWSDAMEFCRKLTELERAAGRIPDGWKYTLPTEAQWEYACRAGTTTYYAFGDTITTKQANFDKTLGKTTNIGKYPANAWGFHDMHGNVSEWCLDWYERLANVSVRDPQGPANGTERVQRGGSWRYQAIYMTSYSRLKYPLHTGKTPAQGFRLSLQAGTERTK